MRKLTVINFILFLAIVFIAHVIFIKPMTKIYNINLVEEKKLNILADDFNDGVNNDYWNIIEQGDNCNNELEYYYPMNITTENSILKIIAKQENMYNYKYTSGMITTQSKFEFLYGKIIIKAKVASGKGLLSAVWLLPSDNTYLPEIDMIEVLGIQPREIWNGIHYFDQIKKKDFNIYTKSDEDYATYELIWEKNEIRWYINNILVHKTNNGIPNKKMYLIVDLAVGGNWPGTPDDSVLPANFLIDYIVIIPEEVT